MSSDLLTSILDHLASLEQPDGGYLPAATPGYFGIADGLSSDIAPAVYAAEIFQTVGLDLPHPDRTAAFIQARQTPEGFFRPPPEWPGQWTEAGKLHGTPLGDCILARFMALQQPNGSWSLGGMHGNFDGAVAVRVLSDNSQPYRAAVERAAEYALTCRTDDGGFRHFSTDPPADLADHVGYPSEVDALFFHAAALVLAGLLPNRLDPANNWIGWGHSL